MGQPQTLPALQSNAGLGGAVNGERDFAPLELVRLDQQQIIHAPRLQIYNVYIIYNT